MSRSSEFQRPHQVKGRPVVTRFGIRNEREPQTKPLKKEASIFSYDGKGRGQNGESSN